MVEADLTTPRRTTTGAFLYRFLSLWTSSFLSDTVVPVAVECTGNDRAISDGMVAAPLRPREVSRG